MLTTYRLVTIRDRGVGPATESAIQESWLTKLGGFGVQGSGVARQDGDHALTRQVEPFEADNTNFMMRPFQALSCFVDSWS